MKTSWILTVICIIFLLPIHSNAQELKRHIVNRDIEYLQIKPNIYILVSNFDLPGMGRIGTNHLLYIKNHKAFLFDSPNDNTLAGELYQFVKDSLHAQITAISIHHWHSDHSGGLDTLHKLGVTSYSYYQTKEFMLEKGLTPAQKIFNDSITIDFEGTKILLGYFGAGHTRDNSIGWIASERILFPGGNIRCMANNNLGYMRDADVAAWPQSVENIRNRFGSAKLIIPGHGDAGGPELIEHTAILAKIGK